MELQVKFKYKQMPNESKYWRTFIIGGTEVEKCTDYNEYVKSFIKDSWDRMRLDPHLTIDDIEFNYITV